MRIGMLYYKSEEIENAMRQPKTLPRYAGLARKVFHFYLGDLYNPETTDCELEYNFRFYIKGFIELKVIDKEPYDWTLIDNFFRFVLHNEGHTFLKYDQSILDKGYNGVLRGKVPKHYA